MSRYTVPKDFMCGLYTIRFGSEREANHFIKRFSGCPVWPILSHGLKKNDVVILALELKEQRHGDFTQENNTLVRNPHYLGAEEVVFRRTDELLDLFTGHTLETGKEDFTPCGSNCEECPLFKNPCQGCPAKYNF
ncbi:MAG: hypothetical protein AMJ53_17000 [Gammaproteobacteria bacterium SG8_11]|nr:MAG: hypothetical protein AMJ53_17000 [Gammaproteobacteria bacterium SG8_11]